MSKRHGVFLLIGLLIALIDGVFVVGNLLLARSALDDGLARRAQTLIGAFRVAADSAGSAPSQRLADDFAQATGAELGFLLSRRPSGSPSGPGGMQGEGGCLTGCDCVLGSSSSPVPAQILDRVERRGDGCLAGTDRPLSVGVGRRRLLALVLPLHAEPVDRNRDSQAPGAALIWCDITERHSAFVRGQWFNLGYGLLALLFMELLFLLIVRGGIRSLEARVARALSDQGESEARLRTLINATPDIICFKDGQGRWLEANDADLTLFQLREIDYRGKTDVELADLTHPLYRDAFLTCTASDEAAWQAGGISRAEETIPTADGAVRVFDVIKVPLFRADGARKGLIVLGRDHTERRQAEAALTESSQRYRAVLDTTRDGFLLLSIEGRILQVNAAFCRLSAYEEAELLRMSVSDLRVEEVPEAAGGRLASIMRQGSELFESVLRCKDGELVPVEISVSYSPVEGGRLLSFVRDIRERKQAEDRVAYMAYNDILTGLPNRALLYNRLGQAMAQHLRAEQLLAVCYLDLDGFKPVNDQYGHQLGDALLVAFAVRVRDALREGDTVARLSGDEFALLLTGLDSPRQAQVVVRRLLDRIEEPFDLDGRQIRISASIGITLYPTDDGDADGLLRHADQAMYQAKAHGKAAYKLYDTVKEQQLRSRMETCVEIDRAIRRDELVLHYQPRIELATGQVVGVEALVRWQHPERGLLYPASFLPVIEGTPQEIALGQWVVIRALAQHATWREDGLVMPVSVNISPKHLQAQGFTELIATALAYHPEGTADQLELEVLESAAIGDIAQVVPVMDACIAMGVHFSLDDFGTGYSSLTYFQRLPIEVLKIDQHFVRGMLDHVSDLDIVEGVLRLAAGLKRPVVAEGVETLEHGLILLYLGCRYAQGYGIARPMPAEGLGDWIADWGSGSNPWQALARADLDAVDDLELRVAIFSHRRWLDQISRYVLDDGEEELPTLGESLCQLGRWYHGVGRARYGDRAAFASIEPRHSRMHELAISILGMLESGDLEGARARFAELQAEGDELSRLLHQLAGSNAAPG